MSEDDTVFAFELGWHGSGNNVKRYTEDGTGTCQEALILSIANAVNALYFKFDDVRHWHIADARTARLESLLQTQRGVSG